MRAVLTPGMLVHVLRPRSCSLNRAPAPHGRLRPRVRVAIPRYLRPGRG